MPLGGCVHRCDCDIVLDGSRYHHPLTRKLGRVWLLLKPIASVWFGGLRHMAMLTRDSRLCTVAWDSCRPGSFLVLTEFGLALLTLTGHVSSQLSAVLAVSQLCSKYNTTTLLTYSSPFSQMTVQYLVQRGTTSLVVTVWCF